MLTMIEQKGREAPVTTESPREVVVEWLQHIMKVKDWTGTDIARKSDLAPSTVLRILNDPAHKFVPALKTLQKIATGTGYPIPRKVTDALGAPSISTGEGKEFAGRTGHRESAPASSAIRRTPMVEVKHVSSLPSSLQPIDRKEIHVPAPARWEGDDTAFAFYMPDNALEPWTPAGSLMYATKRRDPVAGDLVLVTDQAGKSKVRLLLGIDEKGLSLSKIQPGTEEEKMPFDDIKELGIVGIVERF